jgi:hypothetical protein
MFFFFILWKEKNYYYYYYQIKRFNGNKTKYVIRKII